MKVLLMSVLAACSISAACAGSIQLAKDGKALYTIVERPDATRLEKAAVKDLKLYLDKITGGDFKIGEADSKRIFVGVTAPGDDKPLAKAERRIKVVNGDIYLYGESTDSASWAIYDLLEEHIGCRWYTAWGDEKIPSDANLSIPELNASKAPSFWRFETASMGNSWRSPKMRDFLRRRRVHITPDKIPGDDDYLLGFPLHTFCKYLPPGHVPQGTFVNGIGDAYKYFRDKKYFKTNPEWFTMDESGKRTGALQLCLSNRELRKEFLKNLEIVIKNEYKGGDAVIVVDMNDRSRYLCKCPECKKLIEKYETDGGPLYDYLIELAGIFAKKYPKITIRSLAYGCSLVPPNVDLPENVMMWYAPLGGLDYLKSYETASDQNPLENLKKHAKRSKAMWKWMYVTHFHHGHPGAQYTANIQRLADNLRIYHKYNIRCIMTEVGLRSFGYINFHEMRMNMIYALKDNLNADEKAINREFMDFCYGKAADKMAAYLAELEKLGAESKFVMRWRCTRPWNLGYLTPENLVRWEKNFAEMEKLVADNPRQLLHVQMARMILDQTLLGKWDVMSKFDSSFDDARFQAIKDRYAATAEKAADRIFQDHEVDAATLKRYRKNEIGYCMGAIKVAENVKKNPPPTVPIRPLPPELAGVPADRILRVPFLPKAGTLPPADPEGAFGVSMPGDGKLYDSLNFAIFNGSTSATVPHPVKLEHLRSMPKNKFNYYFLGTISIFSVGGYLDTVVTKPRSEASFPGFEEGEDFVADVYISIKFNGRKKIWIDELVLVKK